MVAADWGNLRREPKESMLTSRQVVAGLYLGKTSTPKRPSSGGMDIIR